MIENATFYTFSTGGSHKWRYEGRGFLSEDVFRVHTIEQRREQLLKDNGGKCPGMSTAGTDMVIVVIGDKDVEWGWPLMMYPAGVR